MSRACKSIRGFSLIELMVVLVVLAILATLAAPSLRSLVESRRVQSAAFEFYSSVVLARSEAIKRNQNVTLTLTSFGGSQYGWGVQSAGGETIRAGELASGVIWNIKPSSLTGMTFTSTGRVLPVPSSLTVSPSFQFDSSATRTDNVRCVTIGLSGVPQPRKGACP
jgi:type IV fimbrial biogenesis protein FimT